LRIRSVPDWTCPFCALLCDGFALDEPVRPRLVGSDCPRARAALAQHVRPDTPAAPSIDGRPATLDEAIAEAARRLAQWRQPLFGGLGTDVAGARALVRLAVHTGAICDHADGAAMVQGLRALQDRGQYTATLGELRTRAELIVCVGTPAIERYPEFFRRCGLGEPTARARGWCSSARRPGAPAGRVVVQALPGSGDLFADLQQLALRSAGGHPARPMRRWRRSPGPAGSALCGAGLRAGAPARAGRIAVEAVQRIVATLNGSTARPASRSAAATVRPPRSRSTPG
jgi:formylmethanofuran dehydrogenase subunit B